MVCLINEIGNRYGRLVVLERKGSNIKSGLAMWKCLCDCGNEITVRGSSLRCGATKSCGCLWPLEEGVAAMRALLAIYKRGAKKRDLSFELTEEEFVSLTKQSCYYCSIKPVQVYHPGQCNGDFIYNGIDRIDNNKGYTLDNVVPCCGICNGMKSVMTKDSFLQQIEQIYLHIVRKA